MSSRAKISLVILALLVFVLNTSKGYCQSGVKLFPSEGTVFTNIWLEAFVPINSRNNIFWDDLPIVLDARRGQENYPLTMNINAPNQHPYSDLGNHTITVESFYWDGSDKVMYMNTTFEIIEYFPCDEWLALNATYYNLLADYETLDASYNALQTEYNSLLASYTSLVGEYNILLSDYNSLLSSYDSLSESYATMGQQYNSLGSIYSSLLNAHNQLQSNYNSLSSSLSHLESDYQSLGNSHSSLQGNYNALQSNYNNLKTNYDSLETSYDSLKADYGSLVSNNRSLTTGYNSLVEELGFTRNLGYVFAAMTMILIAATVYLAFRKPKTA